ncbi:hypothetical protein ACH4VM_33910 [Streptomyces sp. NPDC020792]|uniref:hypothetical protein n=1 Tax=Streptomyces sp. NPDC020792 TaxID=3365089 RepID=UPI0037A09214
MFAPNSQSPGLPKRIWGWARRRFPAMLSSALRGAAYAAGAGIVGLMFWWIQHKL